jgi:hypothetical protein
MFFVGSAKNHQQRDSAIHAEVQNEIAEGLSKSSQITGLLRC